MLVHLNAQFLSIPAGLLRQAATFLLLTALAQPSLRAQEKPIVALHDLVSQEIRQQGFTLPRAMKVHVYARGGGARGIGRWQSGGHLHAYGWILNAATREVVWEMD